MARSSAGGHVEVASWSSPWMLAGGLVLVSLSAWRSPVLGLWVGVGKTLGLPIYWGACVSLGVIRG